jgi:LEA14-like dessication related protein
LLSKRLQAIRTGRLEASVTNHKGRTVSNGKHLCLSVFICGFFLLACNPTIRRLEIIRIGNIRLDSIGSELVALRAELAIRNPYSRSARLKTIDFELALAGDFIAYGKRTDSIEIKANSIEIIDVPIVVHSKKVTERDLESLLSNEIPYRIRGSALLERPFGPRTLPIEIQNRLKSPGNLQVFLQRRTAESILSLERQQTTQFLALIRKRKLPVRFSNPFTFPLQIRNFTYEVRLGKQVIAEGTSVQGLQLAPGENRIDLDVQARPLGAVDSLFKGLLDQQIPDLSLSSNFQVVRGERSLNVRLIYHPQ